jgi:hypothetical protein
VAWCHDPLACTWDGVTGYWWEDAHNNQERISKMFSGSLKSIANQKNDKKAWKAVFSHFNQNRGKGCQVWGSMSTGTTPPRKNTPGISEQETALNWF